MAKDNENVKTLKELKEKYNSKELSREERRQMLDEIYRERYKQDKRKPISVYDHTKLACMSKLSLGLMNIYTMISFRVFPKDKDIPIDIIITLILALLTFVFGFKYIMEIASCKAEPDDELSAMNRAKSGEFAFSIWFFAAFLVIGGLAMFTQGKDIRFTASDMMIGASGFFVLYMGIKDFVFLTLEGKPSPDDDGGEE